MKVDKSLLSGSTTLLVLSLLKTGDMYGYEMIAELSRRSDKTFELKEGTRRLSVPRGDPVPHSPRAGTGEMRPLLREGGPHRPGTEVLPHH